MLELPKQPLHHELQSLPVAAPLPTAAERAAKVTNFPAWTLKKQRRHSQEKDSPLNHLQQQLRPLNHAPELIMHWLGLEQKQESQESPSVIGITSVEKLWGPISILWGPISILNNDPLEVLLQAVDLLMEIEEGFSLVSKSPGISMI
nr:hypothetical protein Iba_chr05eCG15070 [Ipomoea batatas]